MTDVHLFQTDDGGEIRSENGQVDTNDGLETAVYLSLFGGNESDSGLEADDPRQWWGNVGETDPARHYRSQTQHLLRSIPATSENLRRVEDAARNDLAWLVEIATRVGATASIPAVNQVRIVTPIEIDDRRYDFVFTEAWRRSVERGQ